MSLKFARYRFVTNPWNMHSNDTNPTRIDYGVVPADLQKLGLMTQIQIIGGKDSDNPTTPRFQDIKIQLKDGNNVPQRVFGTEIAGCGLTPVLGSPFDAYVTCDIIPDPDSKTVDVRMTGKGARTNVLCIFDVWVLYNA
jgi:hypothetical protein